VICVFLSLAYLPQHDNLQFHPFSYKKYNFILFYCWIILHCIYVTHFLHIFIGCWAPKLIP
jgi:hypothetical protein